MEGEFNESENVQSGRSRVEPPRVNINPIPDEDSPYFEDLDEDMDEDMDESMDEAYTPKNPRQTESQNNGQTNSTQPNRQTSSQMPPNNSKNVKFNPTFNSNDSEQSVRKESSPKYEIATVIKKLVETLYKKPYYADSVPEYSENYFMCSGKVSKPKPPVRNEQLKIADLFNGMYLMVEEMRTAEARQFLKDLLNAYKTSDTVSDFIQKYGYVLTPEELQDVLIILQGLNGNLSICTEVETKNDFIKSVKGTFKLKNTMDQIFKNYSSIVTKAEATKPNKAISNKEKPIDEFTKLFSDSSKVSLCESTRKYYSINDSMLFGSHLAPTEKLIHNSLVNAFMYLEIAHGLAYKKKNHFINVDVSVA
jgi:hypothetical protein